LTKILSSAFVGVLALRNDSSLQYDSTVKKNQQIFKRNLGDKLNMSRENIREKMDEF
jgi:hypothetical protein